MRSRATSLSRPSALCLATALAVITMGCGSTTLLSQLSPAEQTKYRGTEPGWHALSPCFAVEIKQNGRAAFYHLRNPQDTKAREALGEQYMYWPTGELVNMKRKFGPRENAYAISEDGRSLLYFTEPKEWFRGPHEGWAPKPFGADLHLYRKGRGDSIIVSDVDHWASPRLVSRQGEPESRVPSDAVVYAPPDKQGHAALRGMWIRGQAVVVWIGEFDPR